MKLLALEGALAVRQRARTSTVAWTSISAIYAQQWQQAVTGRFGLRGRQRRRLWTIERTDGPQILFRPDLGQGRAIDRLFATVTSRAGLVVAPLETDPHLLPAYAEPGRCALRPRPAGRG